MESCARSNKRFHASNVDMNDGLPSGYVRPSGMLSTNWILRKFVKDQKIQNANLNAEKKLEMRSHTCRSFCTHSVQFEHFVGITAVLQIQTSAVPAPTQSASKWLQSEWLRASSTLEASWNYGFFVIENQTMETTSIEMELLSFPQASIVIPQIEVIFLRCLNHPLRYSSLK